MKLWVARDRMTGEVLLFDAQPVKDGEMFYAPTNLDEGIKLGKRPKLGFKLKQGEAVKVKLTGFAKIGRDGWEVADE